MAFVHVDRTVEPPRHPVGRRTTLTADEARPDRLLAIDAWYPAVDSGTAPVPYELLPGVGFTSLAGDGAPDADNAPIFLFSHGMSGNRLLYTRLCEALAARGILVVAVDHPGDTMADWLLGVNVDTTTNEANRVADLAVVADQLRAGTLLPELGGRRDRLHLGGHSYGAFTACTVAAMAGTSTVASVTGLQPHLVPVDREHLAAIECPVLFVVGAEDTSTPYAVDVEPALVHLTADVTVEVLDGIGHQGCSDLGLFVEVAPTMEGLPDLVLDFLETMREGVAGLDQWEPTIATHVAAIADHLERQP